ncbi:MAG TPA: hypothetical protein VNI57_00730, partial [Candidatus Saccharimonadales bacterium]|nr:hypothetical protein [Candidatus Saccharimonadales bacterium]
YFFRDGATLAVAAVFLSLMSLQAFLMNQFASDGDGLALEFLVPLSDVDIVRGKAVGGALLLLAAMVPCILAAALLAPGSPIIHWLAMPLAVASVYALVAPLAAFLSMHFPRKVDLVRMGSAGNAHVAAALIGFVATLVAAVPPMAILGLIGSALGRSGLALGLTAAWAVLCTALSIPLLTGVARLAAARRENLLLVARGR